MWACSSCGVNSPLEGAEPEHSWAARTLRAAPAAAKPLQWASRHKALLLAGATVAGFGAAGLVPAAMIWGGARVFRTATRGPRNMIRNKTKEAAGRAKVVLDQKRVAVQDAMENVRRVSRPAGEFIGDQSRRAGGFVGAQSRRAWNSDLATLGKTRANKVIARAHETTMSMPGTRHVYQAAMAAPAGVAHAADRTREAVADAADRTRQAVADEARQVAHRLRHGDEFTRMARERDRAAHAVAKEQRLQSRRTQIAGLKNDLETIRARNAEQRAKMSPSRDRASQSSPKDSSAARHSSRSSRVEVTVTVTDLPAKVNRVPAPEQPQQ